jgi:uncharacterized protein involved in exopolysaccharide biosynthesis
MKEKMVRSENYVREFLYILFAQKKVIFYVTLLIVLCALLIAFFWPPTYSASGSILVRGKKSEKSPEAIETVELRLGTLTREDLLSEANILTSPEVIEQTIKYLQEKKEYKKAPASLTEDIYAIKGNLKTEVVPATNVVEVVYLDKDPQNALNILGALMDQYVKFRTQVYNPSQTEAFFSEQADRFKGMLENKEKELMGVIDRAGMSEPQEELKNNILIKSDLEKQLVTLRTEAIDKELTLQHLDRVLKDNQMGGQPYFSFINSIPINVLGAKIQDLFIERGRIARVYHPESDKVKLIDNQINETLGLLRSEVEGIRKSQAKELQIINQKIGNITNKINNFDKRNLELNREAKELKKIERESALIQQSYETFAKRREEARSLASVNVPSYISILTKAFPSNGPVFPRKEIVIPLGILVGLLVGCSIGFLRQYFDHTFKKPSDVENNIGLPILFSIPKWDRQQKYTVVQVANF